MIPNTFLVFDVESAGLHGEGWAVGGVVMQRDIELENFRYVCALETARGTIDGFDWCRKNCPPMEPNYESPRDIRTAFWNIWRRYTLERPGTVLVADCGWPVEARFLAQCIDDSPKLRSWEGPYPLHDLASLLFAHGIDPLFTTSERRPDELPLHDPLSDARQSARLLNTILARMALAPETPPADIP